MAWTLWEEFLKVLLAWAVGYFLKGVTGGRMSNTIKGGASTCVIANCQRLGVRRGMCLVCYGKAKAKVTAGEVTWEALTEMGLCREDACADPFDDAYSKAMDCRPTRTE